MTFYRKSVLLHLHLSGWFLIQGLTLNAQSKGSVADLSAPGEHFRHVIELCNDPSTISGTSWFDYHSSIKKAYLFNGNFNLPYTFGGESFNAGKAKRIYQSIQFSPEIKIRLFQNDKTYGDISKPVRTPSYVPRISYFITHHKYWNDSTPKHLYTGISALHHSNGSDGYEFDYTDSVVNIYNGSFSESLYFQWMIGGYHEKKITKPSSILKRKLPESKLHRWLWRVGYEFHPAYFANEKFRLTRLYGGNRIFMQIIWQEIAPLSFRKSKLSGNYLSESWRVSLNAEYITDLTYDKGTLAAHEPIGILEAKKRLNIWLTAMYHFRKTPYLGLFVQCGHHSSDNYNIYFQYSNNFIRGGIALAFFEFRKLK